MKLLKGKRLRPVLCLAVQRRVGQPAWRAFGQVRVSVSLGFRREVRGRWGWPSGHLFIDSSSHEEPGLRCAAVVLLARAWLPWFRTTRRPRPQGLEVGLSIQFKDADEMVLNDPS